MNIIALFLKYIFQVKKKTSQDTYIVHLTFGFVFFLRFLVD